MPELPEVETMVRGIRPYVEGRVIDSLVRCRCQCKPIQLTPRFSTMAKRCKGHTVADVRRIAKKVVLELSTGDTFVIEPRMTGLMLVSEPPDYGHLRLEWRFAESKPDKSLWFWDRRGLGTVRLLSADEFAERLGPRYLGPDALIATTEEIYERLRRTRREIKVALLDQKLIAGIGNLYASEILHQSRIHPERRTEKLNRPTIERLHAAIQDILTTAIRYEGSTLGDGTYRNALNKSGQYQNSHRVYDRAGDKCLSCQRGVIQRIVQAQRSTFFCPVCQRPPRRS